MNRSLKDFFGRIHATDAAPVHSVGNHFVVVGCSHTQGVGLDSFFRYSSVMQRQLNLPVYNLSYGGGCAELNCNYAIRWLHTVGKPQFLVAQWPHPIRKIIWKNGDWSVQNVHATNDGLFAETLRWGEENFWFHWLNSVIITNTAYAALDIPVVNFTLDTIPDQYQSILKHNNIIVSDTDWMLDNAANDAQHHGIRAHAQWAEKIIGTLNELTTR
jgi:hypothetical protein